jgi:hypothetical protein
MAPSKPDIPHPIVPLQPGILPQPAPLSPFVPSQPDNLPDFCPPATVRFATFLENLQSGQRQHNQQVKATIRAGNSAKNALISQRPKYLRRVPPLATP